MSIKIHHGAPGSYKTSGAVADDLLKLLKEEIAIAKKLRGKYKGKTIITNVRGLTADSIFKAMPELHEKVEIINLDTDYKENRDKLATFFHWAENGTWFLIDEAQSIFPKRWTKKDIEVLDFPGGIDAATELNKPHDWSTAWEKHRHYGWHFVLTTPNISLIRSDICDVAEGGYKHVNMANIGIKGRYLESFHLATNNGSSSKILSTKTKKIPKIVWNLYESTAIGDFEDTRAGGGFLSRGKILLALSIFLAAAYFTYTNYKDTSAFDRLAGSETKESKARNMAQPGQKNSNQNYKGGPVYSNIPNNTLVDQSDDPLNEQQVDIIGYLWNKNRSIYVFSVIKENTSYIIRSQQLSNLGYTIQGYGECGAKLIYKNKKMWATCGNRSKASGAFQSEAPQIGMNAK